MKNRGNICQTVFDQSLSDRRVLYYLFGYLRRLILRYHDPIVYYNLNGRRIAINLSHALPYYRKAFPTYSTNLARLAQFIRVHFGGALHMIDVGANIGDSYCLASGKSSDDYLLIEGDPRYFELLSRNVNTAGRSVTIVQALVSDEAGVGGARIVAEDGTARVVNDSGASGQLSYTTLDEIIESYPGFRSPNLLKTDVDGYDCKVLRGGLKLIAAATPVIFFEHHPRLLAALGEDESIIFAILIKMGYQRLILYDNFGFLIGIMDAHDKNRISDLVFYARQRSGYYYDVCCFPDSSSDLRDRFLAQEKLFFTEMLAGATG